MPQSMCNWLLLMVFLMQFIVHFFVRFTWEIFSESPLDQYNYILVSEIFAVGLPAVLFCLISNSGFIKTFGIKSVRFSKLWKCFGLGVCLQPVAVFVNMLWKNAVNIPTESASYITASTGLKEMVVIFLFTCVVPALSEELLLRGMYLSSVKRKGYTFSIVATTAMFVLLHTDYGNVAAYIILSVAAAFATLNTNSVYGGIFVHLAFNLGGMVLSYITSKYYTPGGFVGTFDFYLALGVAGLVLSILFFKGVYAKKMKKIASSEFLPNLFKAFFNIPVLIIIVIYVLRIL